jgi:hypothetical protein
VTGWVRLWEWIVFWVFLGWALMIWSIDDMGIDGKGIEDCIDDMGL